MNEEDFDKLIKEWIEYCKTSINRNINIITECEAYKKLLCEGCKTLPLIRRLYNKNSSDNFALSIVQGGLVQLVHEIIGEDFSVPQEILGNIQAMKKYTKNWLDENMNKYLL